MSVKELIAEYGLRPNKALGQNFLIDENAIERIVSLALEPGLPLLEIGPGLGALTYPLAESGLPLAAVELDGALSKILAEKLPENARVVNRDFLKADLKELHGLLGGGEITAVGNLPYYITSQIVARLVTGGLPIRRMVLMMQSEASERFTAAPKDKNYVPLTVMSQYLFEISEALELGPASYWPQPEVRSRVLVFDRVKDGLPAGLPRLLKAAFANRRKTLVNNLSALGLPKQAAEGMILDLGLSASVRAEELSVREFIRLEAAVRQ